VSLASSERGQRLIEQLELAIEDLEETQAVAEAKPWGYAVATVNSIQLAYSRESSDARAYGRHPQTDLVGDQRGVPIKIFAHMGRFWSRGEIHTRIDRLCHVAKYSA